MRQRKINELQRGDKFRYGEDSPDWVVVHRFGEGDSSDSSIHVRSDGGAHRYFYPKDAAWNKEVILYQTDKDILYLVIYIGPTGFNWVNVRLTDQRPDPKVITKGEGQCFVFRMVDFDCSTNFHQALTDGTLLADLGNILIEGDARQAIKRAKGL